MRRIWLAMLLVCPPMGRVWAEDPVYFADPRLKAAVEDALWVSDPTPTDMLGLTSLNAGSRLIESLTGLEHAANLQTLNLHFNRISDLSALSGLSNLETLRLGENELSDISPLSSLDNLDTLYLNQNEISNLSPLSGLTKLQFLDIHHNAISNVSPLSDLTNVWNLALRENPLRDIGPLSGMSGLEDLSLLDTLVSDVSPLCGLPLLMNLDLRNCPLSQDSYDIYIPRLRANNPGIFIDLDPEAGRTLTVSSTVGGSVIQPGEGEFTYAFDEIVQIEVRADPGFVFAGWSGTAPLWGNPTSLTMEQNYQIRADFMSLQNVLHVDDDAPDDPGPGDPNLSDPNENGTVEHPFDRIQEAIAVAGNGTSMRVRSGVYRENVDLRGKDIQLIGASPADPVEAPWPVLDGGQAGPVLWLGEGKAANCLLTGFVITGGRGQLAGAIDCYDARATISHCLIVGNRATDPDGGAIYCVDSEVTFVNCTLAGNGAGPQGAAITAIDSDITVIDSILWGNSPREVVSSGIKRPSIQYSDVRGWWADFGNLNTDPLFVRPGRWVDPKNTEEVLGPKDAHAVWVQGDYHLASPAGRWDPNSLGWVQDVQTSPCIDAGHPDSPVGPEPAPNGGIINMGAYGGTTQAAKSDSGAISP